MSFSKTTASPGLARGVLDQVFKFISILHSVAGFAIGEIVVKFRDDRNFRYNFGEARFSAHTSGPHRLFICGGDVLLLGSPRPVDRCIFPAAQFRFEWRL